MNKKIVLIGGGGHAQVILEILERQNELIYGYVAKETSCFKNFKKINYLGTDDELLKEKPQDFHLINCLPIMPKRTFPVDLIAKYKRKGFQFKNVISEQAYVSPKSILGEGCQIMDGARLNVESKVGDFVILNTNSTVEHHCNIDHFSHICPGAVVCGNVEIGKTVFIGANSTIINNICISSERIVAAGDVITKDL